MRLLASFCHKLWKNFIRIISVRVSLLVLMAAQASPQVSLAKSSGAQGPQKDKIQLLLWQPSPSHPQFVIPKYASESAKEAVEAFLDSVSSDDSFRDLALARNTLSPASEVTLKVFEPGQSQSEANLIVANRQNDQILEDPRLQDFVKIIPKDQNYSVLPIGASLRLAKAARAEFHKLLAGVFQRTFFLGGVDIDQTHLPDFLEIQLAKDLYLSKKGRLIGFCRGAQLIALSLGYQLIQDIPTLVGREVLHGSGVPGGQGVWHPVFFKSTPKQWIARMSEVEIEGTPGEASLDLNSYHHQAIDFRKGKSKSSKGGVLRLAGLAPDGVGELFESNNGRVLLRQDHPEKNPTANQYKPFLRNLFSPSFAPSTGIHCEKLLQAAS